MSPRWRAQSLSKGATGIALLHAARAGLANWVQAHARVTVAADDPLAAAPGTGL
ncbi:hypothetical protein [Nonomuraea endophytica]|uniref:Uncharacterized protein n=1 Tax=Nonomuraea endophytica TaxID=714136 RepID=A0A7W8ACN7_9ACTN|nr:hypothetical protein [Nonomuraea endophytica]MBB5083851.1 hypothetical protein [Nonomuraea endophytica]